MAEERGRAKERKRERAKRRCVPKTITCCIRRHEARKTPLASSLLLTPLTFHPVSSRTFRGTALNRRISPRRILDIPIFAISSYRPYRVTRSLLFCRPMHFPGKKCRQAEQAEKRGNGVSFKTRLPNFFVDAIDERSRRSASSFCPFRGQVPLTVRRSSFSLEYFSRAVSCPENGPRSSTRASRFLANRALLERHSWPTLSSSRASHGFRIALPAAEHSAHAPSHASSQPGIFACIFMKSLFRMTIHRDEQRTMTASTEMQR